MRKREMENRITERKRRKRELTEKGGKRMR